MKKRFGFIFLVTFAALFNVRAMDVAPSLTLLRSNLLALNQELADRMCAICLDTKAKQWFTRLGCSHEFCTDCLRDALDIAITDKNTSCLQCARCSQKFTEEDIRKLDPYSFNAISRILFNEWVRVQPGFKNCPTRDCSFVFIQDPNAPVQTIRCPDCRQEYCSSCSAYHLRQIPCSEIKTASAQEQANIEWKKQHTKRCPKCKVDIQKNEGCIHMNCTQCKTHFCWICLGDFFGNTHNSFYCPNEASMLAAQTQSISQQLAQAPAAAGLRTDIPQGYILSWVAGMPTNRYHYNLDQYIARKQLPVVVRIGFNKLVNGAFLGDFLRNMPGSRISINYPNNYEVEILLAPGSSRAEFQKNLDTANSRVPEIVR